MAKTLGLEVPASTGQLFLALCWSLIGNQQSGNDHDENANNKKLIQVLDQHSPCDECEDSQAQTNDCNCC
jgi:hypothetical protein